MRLSQPITQGGQTFLHKCRMWSQIVRLSVQLFFVISFLTFLFLCFFKLPLHILCQEYLHQIVDGISWLIGLDKPHTYYSKNLNWPHIHWQFKKFLSISVCIGILASLMMFMIWHHQGVKAHKQKPTAGLRFLNEKQVRHLILKNADASWIKFMHLPLIKNCETQHMLITGTTGSGKTNAFKHLMQQIRPRGRAIILDTTGEFVNHFYNPQTDIMMNPFDQNFLGWDLGKECSQPYHYDEVAESLIPSNSHDPFWSQSSQTVLAEILKHLANRHTMSFSKILNMTNKMRLEELYDELHYTKAGALLDPKSEKTATSIRMNLATHLNSFESLVGMHETPFSIRQWVQKETQHDHNHSWLFLTMMPAQRSTLRPLLSCWLSIAIKSLMEMGPCQTEKLWFMIDELPSLNKLTDLPLCLAEGRKYGACMVLGLQNISQMESIYGPNITQSILDLCSTKIIFRSASFNMAQKLSYLLGMQERKEIQEGISYGANEIRDGVSLNVHTIEKPIIPAYDLMNLPDLSSYIQLPKNYPVTKIKWDVLHAKVGEHIHA